MPGTARLQIGAGWPSRDREGRTGRADQVRNDLNMPGRIKMRPQTIERHNLIRKVVDEEFKKNPNATAEQIYLKVSKKTGLSIWTIRDIANRTEKLKSKAFKKGC